MASSVTSTEQRPLRTTASATACLAGPATTAIAERRGAELVEREPDRARVEGGVDDVAVGVDVAADDVADGALLHEHVDVGHREVAALDVHRVVVGGAGAEQVGVGGAGELDHARDDAVGLDGLLGREALEDGGARQQGGAAAALLRDADGGRRRGAGPAVEAHAAVDLHDVDAGGPAVAQVLGDLEERATPADAEGAGHGAERREVVGRGLRGALLQLLGRVHAGGRDDDRRR